MSWTTAAICEACWMKENFKAGGSEDKFDYQFKVPVRVSTDQILEDDEVEFCGKCGSPTISGIYERIEV